MSVQVFIAHTGGCHLVDSGDSIPQLVANAGIPANRQILLTARGRQAKNLQGETEIFAFDKQLPPVSVRSSPKTSLRQAPTTPDDDTSLQSWQELFMSRRTWALGAIDVVKAGIEHIGCCQDEEDVFQRSAEAALENLRRSLDSLKQKFETTKRWVEECLEDQTNVLEEYEANAHTFRDVEVRGDICAQLGAPGSRTLRDCLDLPALEEAADRLSKTSTRSRRKFEEIQEAGNEIFGREISHTKDGHALAENTDGFMDEAEALATRINRDYEDVLQLPPGDPKSVTTASRRDMIHTRDLLPALRTLVEELGQAVTSTTENRNSAAQSCFRVLQKNTTTQSKLAEVHAKIASINMDAYDDFEALNNVSKLPVLYGTALIDAFRRAEWMEHLPSELATDGLGLPRSKRAEVNSYIQTLQALGLDDPAEHLSLLVKGLDAPGDDKGARPKAFKNGSVHDLRGSTMQDERLRLEEKLRASESRVRKLEDLLHRQSQLSRPPVETFTPMPELERNAPTPNMVRNTDISRRSSISSRRLSNQHPEEKVLVQRIVSLEAELVKLQQEAHAERRSGAESRDRMNEAEAVKKDLMANFEAQRQEFEEERQLLEEENNRLKVRIEEAEDELDHTLDSKMVQDQTVDVLHSEIEHLKRTAASELDSQLQMLEKRLTLEHGHILDELKKAADTKETGAIEKLKKTTAAEHSRAIEILKKEYTSQHNKQLAELRGELDGSTSTQQQSLNEISRLRSELSELRSTTASNGQEEIDKLHQLLDDVRSELRESERVSKSRVVGILESLGFSITRPDGSQSFVIQRTSKLNASMSLPPNRRSVSTSDVDGRETSPSTIKTLPASEPLDLDSLIELITKRYRDVETLAKKYQKDSRAYREKAHRLQHEAHDKIAYRSFKEGDLALFLPTRNQATRPWAAFNVGAPHYFLREQDAHKLQTRDWLLARISKVEERMVDLSRSMSTLVRNQASVHTEVSDGASMRSVDDNPFELSDGLRWYMIDAQEEKPGAPTTPSVGKSTVAASVVEVEGHMGRKEGKSGTNTSANAATVTKTLSKSLDSRRSSEASRKSTTAGLTKAPSLMKMDTAISAEGNSREEAEVFDVVRKDLLLGP